MAVEEAFWLTPVEEKLNSNAARKGDSDFKAPGPVPGKGLPAAKKAKTPTGVKQDPTKHPHKAAGPGGGQFVSSGSSGSAVDTIQRELGVAQTGTYDAGTAASVIAFQKRHGLQVDGIIGKQTALALGGKYQEARATAPGALDARTAAMVGATAPAAAKSSRARRKPRERVGGGLLVADLQEGDLESIAEEAARIEITYLLVEDDLGQLIEAEAFDPALHPRDALGKFALKVGGLTKPGEAGPTHVALPDGTRVSRDRDGTLRVVRSGRIVRGIKSPNVAALNAFERSARGRQPESIGGARSQSINDAMPDLVHVEPGLSAATITGKIDTTNSELMRLRAHDDEYTRRQIPTLQQRLRALRQAWVTADRNERAGTPASSAPGATPTQSTALPGTPDAPNVSRGAAGSSSRLPNGAVRATVSMNWAGNEATFDVVSGPSDPGQPPVQVWSKKVDLIHLRTRTGNTMHPNRAYFDLLPEDAPPPRRYAPEITVDGRRYALRRTGVARNRPASTVGWGPGASLTPAVHNVPRPAEPSRPSVPAAPASEQSIRVARVHGLLTSWTSGPASEVASRRLGTRITNVETHDGIVYARGEDGRVWSVNPQALAGFGYNNRTVQMRTQGGASYTAPAMLSLLTGDPMQGSSRGLAEKDPSIVPHPAAPIGTATAPSASRSGPSPAIPPPSAIGAAPQNRDAEPGSQAARLNAIVSSLHGFEHGGLTTKIYSVSPRGFNGSVLDSNGRAVGSFSREVTSPTTIYHAMFSIEGTERDTGYGSAVIDKMFSTYKENGFTHVEVSAGLSVGGYQWAKMGFEFKDSDKKQAANYLLRQNSGKIQSAVSSGHVPQALADEFIRQLEEGQLTSPSMIAAWGRRTTWIERRDGKDITMWLGKTFLLGSGWSGRKKL